MIPNWKMYWKANPYGDAQKACEAWLAGSLMGNPIHLRGKIHVYGVNKKLWTSVWVEFTNKHILVVKAGRPK